MNKYVHIKLFIAYLGIFRYYYGREIGFKKEIFEMNILEDKWEEVLTTVKIEHELSQISF